MGDRPFAFGRRRYADMKALLDKLVESDVELAMYVREARIELTREPEPAHLN